LRGSQEFLVAAKARCDAGGNLFKERVINIKKSTKARIGGRSSSRSDAHWS